jgi:hypothetical protein
MELIGKRQESRTSYESMPKEYTSLSAVMGTVASGVPIESAAEDSGRKVVSINSGAIHLASSTPWKPQSGGCGIAATPMSVRSAQPRGLTNTVDWKLPFHIKDGVKEKREKTYAFEISVDDWRILGVQVA